jgi:hypothetical protein
VLIFTSIPFFWFVDSKFCEKKILKKLGNISFCTHEFPSECHHVKLVCSGLFEKIVVVKISLLFSILISAFFVDLILKAKSLNIEYFAYLLLVVLFAFLSFQSFMLIVRNRRFRRLNGRRARTSDILPIDPETGQMPYRPFDEPVPAS